METLPFVDVVLGSTALTVAVLMTYRVRDWLRAHPLKFRQNKRYTHAEAG